LLNPPPPFVCTFFRPLFPSVFDHRLDAFRFVPVPGSNLGTASFLGMEHPFFRGEGVLAFCGGCHAFVVIVFRSKLTSSTLPSPSYVSFFESPHPHLNIAPSPNPPVTPTVFSKVPRLLPFPLLVLISHTPFFSTPCPPFVLRHCHYPSFSVFSFPPLPFFGSLSFSPLPFPPSTVLPLTLLLGVRLPVPFMFSHPPLLHFPP